MCILSSHSLAALATVCQTGENKQGKSPSLKHCRFQWNMMENTLKTSKCSNNKDYEATYNRMTLVEFFAFVIVILIFHMVVNSDMKRNSACQSHKAPGAKNKKWNANLKASWLLLAYSQGDATARHIKYGARLTDFYCRWPSRLNP